MEFFSLGPLQGVIQPSLIKLRNIICEVVLNIIIQIHTIFQKIFVDIHLKDKDMHFNPKVWSKEQTSKSTVNFTVYKKNVK